MANRRKTVWKDAIVEPTAIPINSIDNNEILSEPDIEEHAQGSTLTRIVGTINLKMNQLALTFTNISGAIYIFNTYAGAAFPTIWIIDTFERVNTMWTLQAQLATGDDTLRIPIDIRTQRKLGSGIQVMLSIQNFSVQDSCVFSFHLRSLLKLA